MTIPDPLLATLRLLADALDTSRARFAAYELSFANFAAVTPRECYVVWAVGPPPHILGSCQQLSALERMVESCSEQITVQQWDGTSWTRMEVGDGTDVEVAP